MKLGQGGMADVYLTVSRATPGFERLAVIKRLRTDLLVDQDEDAQDAEHFVTMFRDEARLSILLKHANIVHTYDVFEEAGTLHLVMEFVDGQSLNVVQRELAKQQQPLARDHAALIVAEVLAGLHYAHEVTDLNGDKLNIVHRDVSPQNVLIGYDGTIKLVDFGVAKASFRSSQTRAGTMKGKARYMAPEQVVNKNVDRRADVYSAGVMLWELLAGRKLITGANMFEQLVNVLKVPAPRLATEIPDIEPELDAIVDKALSRDPAGRFATASDMRDALLQYVARTGTAQPKEIGALVSSAFASHREKLQGLIRARLAAPETDVNVGAVPSELNLSAAFSALDSDDLRSMSGKTTSSSGSRPVQTRSDVSGAGPVSVSPESASMPLVPSRPPARASAPPASGVDSVRAPKRSQRPLVLGVILLLGVGVFTGVYLSRLKQVDGAAQNALGAAEPAGGATTPAPTVKAEATEKPAEAPEPIASALPSAGPASAPARATTPAAPPAPVVRPYVPVAPNRGGAAAPKPTAEPTPAPAPAPAPAEAPGFLTLDTYPWTRVTVNGKSVGSTPLVRLSLGPGTHTIVMENPGEGIRESTTVTIKSGETTSKRLAFDDK
ncbi:MAG: protein kinase [Labilithrix sp.]|nr:protein kinase [Labilithrix sp.]